MLSKVKRKSFGSSSPGSPPEKRRRGATGSDSKDRKSTRRSPPFVSAVLASLLPFGFCRGRRQERGPLFVR